MARKNIGHFKRQPREMPSKILISNDGPSVGSKKFEHCEIKPLKIFGANDGESVTRKNIGRFKRQPREMPSKILISNDGPSVGSKKFEHCEIKSSKIFGANDGEFIEEKNI